MTLGQLAACAGSSSSSSSESVNTRCSGRAASALCQRAQQQQRQLVSQEALHSYCQRLDAVLDPSNSEADRRLLDAVHDFKEFYPERFREIARVQLSFLVDLPYFEVDAGAGVARRQSKRRAVQLPLLSSAKRGRLPKASGNSGFCVSRPAVDRIAALMAHLVEGERYKVEGIFRKTGNCGRQKELKRLLLAGADCDLADYTVHDIANVMKMLLRNLEEPLLSDSLCEILIAIAELSSPRYNDKGSLCQRTAVEDRIVRCRQLKAVRILLQLMPGRNVALLSSILSFLHSVGNCKETKMSSATLGTVFGPVLLGSKSVEAAALQKKVENLNSICSFLIDNCCRIGQLPRSFADDIRKNLSKVGCADPSGDSCSYDAGACRMSTTAASEAAAAASAASAAATPASPDDSVDTSVRFSERRQPAASADYSQQQLAALYAHIRCLPESKEKRRLEKRFNHHSCCTPDRQFCSFRKRLAAARSYGRLGGGSDDATAAAESRSGSGSGSSSSSSATPVSRFFGRDRRLMRALSSIRVYKTHRRQELEQLRGRLSFDNDATAPAVAKSSSSSSSSSSSADAVGRKRRRLSGVVSSPKLLFSDSANFSSPSSSCGSRLLRVSCSTIFESPAPPRFLETAL